MFVSYEHNRIMLAGISLQFVSLLLQCRLFLLFAFDVVAMHSSDCRNSTSLNDMKLHFDPVTLRCSILILCNVSISIGHVHLFSFLLHTFLTPSHRIASHSVSMYGMEFETGKE